MCSLYTTIILPRPPIFFLKNLGELFSTNTDILQVSCTQLILIVIISCMYFLLVNNGKNVTDAQLLEQVKDSDMEAFRRLFERYQPVLFRHVLYQTRETDLSHDIVQQTFISVWEHRSTLQPHLSFLAYILRISRNLIMDSVKHQKIRDRIDATLPPQDRSELDDPAEALHLAMLQETITRIINDLPQKCREIFLLSRFEGKTNQEIADSLHLSVRTVEHQITKALKVLRKHI